MDLQKIAITEKRNSEKSYYAGIEKMRKDKEKKEKEQSELDKAEAREKKELLKIQRMQLSAKAKGISEEEQIRQDKFDFSAKAKTRMIASELKKSGGVETKKTKAMSKSLKEEEDTEKARREGQSMTLLEKIAKNTTGLSKGIKDFVGKTPTGLKAILAGVAFFALAKFLQSGTWKKMVSFIVDTILPSLEAFYEDIKEFDFTLTGENGLFKLIKDNFLVLLGALAILKPKLLFNLAKTAFFGLFNGIKFMYTEMAGNFFGVKFAKTRAFMSKFKVASAAVGRGFAWTGNLLGKMVAKPLVMLKAGAIKMMTGLSALGRGIMWIGKFLLKNPIVLLIVAIIAIIAAVVYYWDDIKQKFEDLGGVAGIFASIVANVKDALSGVANKLIKAYNFLTGSDVELFDTGRAKKVTEKLEADVEEKKAAKKAQLDENERAKNQRAEYEKQQAKSLESLDSKTPEEKILSFEEMTAATMTKLMGLMNGKERPNTTVVNNNSQNNKTSNVSQANINATDPTYPQSSTL